MTETVAGACSPPRAADAGPAAAPRQSEILPLTSLRFVAAFWVFLFHMNIWWPLALPGPLATLVAQGAVGMSVFFILSGFVLGYSYGQRELPVRRYAWHRFARIYPVYMLAGLVTLPFLVPPGTTASAAQVAFIVLAHLLMLQAWFPPLIPYWNFGASWSLSAEAFFYAVFPFALPAVKSLRGRGWIAFMVAAWLLCVLPGLAYALFRPSPPIYYVMPIFRLPEFLVGVGCAVYFNRGGRIPAPRLVAGASALALAVYLVVAPRSDVYVTANVVAVPAIALLILSLAQQDGGVLASGPLLTLGRASYAFYSLQPLVITSMIRWQRGAPQWNSLAAFCGALASLVALSLLAYFFVEEPMRRRLANRGG